jgi:hypothetical protein
MRNHLLLDDDDDDDDDCLPNAIVNHEYDVEAPSFPSNFIYTTDQRWIVSLLKILDRANAPDYAFGNILEWGRYASAQSYSFNPVGGLSCSKNVDSLINSLWNGNKLLPFDCRVIVPHGPPSDVICFDFVPQLLSLLQNPTIMTAENLVIDIDNPLKPYASQGNILSEALSGSVYHKGRVPLINHGSQYPTLWHGVIMALCPRGSHHLLRTRFNARAISSKTTVQRLVVHLSHLGSVAHACVVWFYQLVPPSCCLRIDIVTCLLFVIQDMNEGDMLCG